MSDVTDDKNFKGHVPLEKEFEIEIALYLGPGDNNSGEMWGLLTAFTCLDILSMDLENNIADHIDLIFSDSLGCISYLTSTWPSPTSRRVSRKTRRKFNDGFKKRQGRIYWIRGHAGIEGNEKADSLAKEGVAMGRNTCKKVGVQYKGCNAAIRLAISEARIQDLLES